MLRICQLCFSFSALLVPLSCASAPRAAALCPAAPLASAEVEVPFELVGNRVYVQAHVNGRGPYRFLVDNGAGGLGRADVGLARELGLPKVGTAQNSDGVNTSEIDVVRVCSLRVGGLEMRDVDLWSRDYNSTNAPNRPATAGIIGEQFFADGTLTLDFPARILRFSRTERLCRAASDVVPYTGPFIIPFFIGDRRFEGSVDTGSNLPLHLPMSTLRQLAASPPVPAGQARRANTIFYLHDSRLREPVRISGLTLTDLTVKASEQANRIIIGGAILQNAVVSIDQTQRLLSIRPSAGAGTRPGG